MNSNEAGVETAAHYVLELSRLFLANGADTGQVHRQIRRFAEALGYEARLAITAEAVLLTMEQRSGVYTKVGRPIASVAVDMDALIKLDAIVERVSSRGATIEQIAPDIARLELRKRLYPAWLVPLAMGGTGACLAQLFGGDILIMSVAFFAAGAATWVRQILSAWHFGPTFAVFVAASIGGVIGGLGMRWFHHPNAAICIVSPAMVLVPGIPIINGIREIFAGDASLGLARLSVSLLAVGSIGFGVLTATLLTGVDVPILATNQLPGIPKDALFSGLAVGGFCCLFNVPLRASIACAVCGIASHTLRALLLNLGIDITIATLLGALVASSLAVVFSKIYAAPPATFVFPGVLAMVPGSYAFRTVLGALEIMRAGEQTPTSLLATTASLAITTFLLCMALAIGISLPMSVDRQYRTARDTVRDRRLA